jgi:DNA-directed RNA polymerase specialized sigma24 family protein
LWLACHREILLLRHAERMPFEEIACLLDIEPGAARKRFGRALIRLQQRLPDRGLLELFVEVIAW